MPDSEQAGGIERGQWPQEAPGDRRPSGAQALAGIGQRPPWELAH